MNMENGGILVSNYGLMPLPCTALVTLLDIALYLFVLINVARARGKYKVQVPSMDGPPEFIRTLRVQINMSEQLMLHLPLLWIAALAMDDVFAAAFGAIWLVGRILYARGYYLKAKRRMKGFIVSMMVNAVLLIAAVVGVVASF